MMPEYLFSDDRKYRYILRRQWDESLPECMFIGLNPSTADEVQDDPTIRRCIGFARDWGYGTLWMGNIFAYRATDPKDMKAHEELPEAKAMNELCLLSMAARSDLIVLAWGNHGTYKNRGQEVLGLLGGCDSSLNNIKCLKVTKQNQPSHPLYLPKNSEPLELCLKNYGL